MKARGRRVKGALFERAVADLILKLVGKPFTKKDCYRTPLSGGHRFSAKSDLMLSSRLKKVFPFSVECKHQKTFTLQMLFSETKLIHDWMDQAVAGCVRDNAKLLPLLVMRGNGTPVFAAVPSDQLTQWAHWHPCAKTHMRMYHNKTSWRVYRWDVFQSIMSPRCRQASKLLGFTGKTK